MAFIEKIQKHRILIIWLLFAVVFGILNASLASLLNMDDNVFRIYFDTWKTNGGVFQALLRFVSLQDFSSSGELRTYGLSRLLQCIIMIITNDSAPFYQFIIAFSQVASGYCIYHILNKLKIKNIISIPAGIIWSLSPFARVQTFHHWSYLMLPAYLSLLLVIHCLDVYNERINQDPRKSTLSGNPGGYKKEFMWLHPDFFDDIYG